MIFIAFALKHMIFLYIDQFLSKIDKKGKPYHSNSAES